MKTKIYLTIFVLLNNELDNCFVFLRTTLSDGKKSQPVKFHGLLKQHNKKIIKKYLQALIVCHGQELYIFLIFFSVLHSILQNI